MTNVLTIRKQYRMQEWAKIIQQCHSSGLSNRKFCRQNGISEKTYYYRLRQLREHAVAEESSQIPQLIQLDIPAQEKSEDLIHIQYRNAELTLPGTVDFDALAALLRSIQTT